MLLVSLLSFDRAIRLIAKPQMGDVQQMATHLKELTAQQPDDVPPTA
jgi:hypothetical protein